MINNAVSSNNPSTNQLLWGFIGLVIVTSLTGILSRFLLVSLSQEAFYKLRLRLSGWILACPLRHLEELGANRLLATLTDDTQSISMAVLNIPFLGINIALLVSCLAYLYWLSWVVFLLTFVFLAVALGCVQFLITKTNDLLILARDEKDRLFKHFRAVTDGIKELKLHRLRREAFLTEELRVTAASSRDYSINGLRIGSLAMTFAELLFFILLGLLVFGLPKLTPINNLVLSGYVLTLTYIDLSQGQCKRLALLTAYLENRPIYLFDEWASDQDPFFREIFYKQLLPELKHKGKTVLVISHDDRYFHLGDRMLKLNYGKLV